MSNEMKHIDTFKKFSFNEKYNLYTINEIADTDAKIDVVKESLSINKSSIWIRIKNKIYMVVFKMHGYLEKSSLTIDFLLQTNENEYSNDMTNDNDTINVMSHIISTIKYYFSCNIDTQSYSGQIVDFNDINLVSFVFISKGEDSIDRRRSNIYKYYLYKNLQKMKINIIEEKDITDEYKKAFPQISHMNFIVFKYKIEPITIGEIKKRLQNS